MGFNRIEKFIKNNYLNYLIIEVLSKGIPFIATPIIVNNTTKDTYGKFSLFLSALPILGIIVLGMGQKTAIARIWIFASEEKLNKLVFISFLNSFFCFLLLFFVSYTKKSPLWNSEIINITLIAGISYAFLDIYLHLLTLKKEKKQYNILYLVRQITPYFSIILYILMSNHTVTFIDLSTTYTIPLAILGINIFIKYLKISYKSINLGTYIKYSKYIFHFAKYSILTAGSAFILTFADRYMIAYFYSSKEVAEYSIAYTVAMILSIIILAMNKAWQPFILENLKRKNFQTIQKYGRLYIISVLILTVLIAISRKWILLIISNSSYLSVADIIPIMLAGMFFYFLYTLYSNVAFYYKRMSLFSLPSITAALLNIILNAILLPKMGFKIAAWTTLISYFIQFLIIYFIVTKILRTKIV